MEKWRGRRVAADSKLSIGCELTGKNTWSCVTTWAAAQGMGYFPAVCPVATFIVCCSLYDRNGFAKCFVLCCAAGGACKETYIDLKA